MNKVIVRLKTSSIKDSEIFYCKELELFKFYQDYGMETISLIAKDNSSFILLLTTGNLTDTEYPADKVHISGSMVVDYFC